MSPSSNQNSDGNIIVRKNDFDQFPHTVLLLNGIHQTRGMWTVMEGRLRRYHFGVCSLNLSNIYSEHRFATLENQSQWLHNKLDRLFTKYDLEHIHIVGSSTGGLVARHMIQHHDKGMRIRSLCTLGTPHHSSMMGLLNTLVRGKDINKFRLPNLPTFQFFKNVEGSQFPEHIPVTSIFGSKDWLTPWWSSVLRQDSHPLISNIHLRSVRSLDLSSDAQAFEAVRTHLERALDR